MAIETKVGAPTEQPAGIVDRSGHPVWGSDLIVDVLRKLDVEYAAILPGATFRGIHDSAVNYAANHAPELILCNHEMTTVAMATGYARVTGRPMAAIVHNLVGLLNTTMTIYDAWCDRVPVIVLGGTGPMDATLRRPWIDWIHTALVQGNAVRDYTKFDDQPASVAAIPESLMRAYRMAVTEPAGPVYVCFDIALQEEEIKEPIPLPDFARFRASAAAEPDGNALREAAAWLVGAEMPLVFAEWTGRHPEAVPPLRELAELLATPVIDSRLRFNFPTPHDLDFEGLEAELVEEADVVLALDMVDLAGALRRRRGPNGQKSSGEQRVISISLDELIHRSWTTDYQALPAVDLPMLGNTALALPILLEECRQLVNAGARERIERRRAALRPRQEALRAKRRKYVEDHWEGQEITEQRMLAEVWDAIKDEDFAITRGGVTREAPGVFHLTEPGHYYGRGGGGAVGAGPGVALGAALGLRGTGKLPVGLFGDGDFISGIHAVWTGAHYKIPSLWVVNNNRSYFNDEAHQDRVARRRDRPPENRWVAMRLENPEIDIASVVRGLGASAEGPISTPEELRAALRRGIEAVKRGELVVLDVRTDNPEVEG